MSSWLKSYQALRNHPKTRKLARRVGGIPAAIGYLHCLWWWCMDYAPDGDLSGHDSEDIAVACDWDGDPDEIIEHLVASGFIDRDGDVLAVHDWDCYGGAVLAGREGNRERAKASYERRKDSLRAGFAQSTGLDRKKDRKKRGRARVTRRCSARPRQDRTACG